jgi:hypothetical protein
MTEPPASTLVSGERRYRERVVKQLHRRAAEFGSTFQEAATTQSVS